MKETAAFLAMLAYLTSANVAQAQHWNLPAELNDGSMSVKFAVDTTWHTIHGKADNLRGKVWLDSIKDARSIRASLTIPVAALDTDNEDRDKEMRASMDADKFPGIGIDVPSISPSCEESALSSGARCDYSAQAFITIRDVTLPLSLHGALHRGEGGSIVIDGKTELNWASFGVKDPSILIAAVHEKVDIDYKISLPAQKSDR